MNLMAHHQQREQAATGSSKPETGENALEMANAEVQNPGKRNCLEIMLLTPPPPPK